MSSTEAIEKRRIKVRRGIYRRTNRDGGTVYEIVYRGSDGVQVSETVGPRLQDAEDRLAQAKADMSRGMRSTRTRRLTVADAAEVFMATGTGHLRPKTVSHYRASLDLHVLPAFGRRRLDSITPDDLAQWLQHAQTAAYASERGRSKPYRAATIRHVLTTLHRVYGHAIRRQGYCGMSPVSALERHERPRDEPKPQVILTPEEVSALLAAADRLDAVPGRYGARSAYGPVLAFLAGTGCRISEALGLTWADLDLTGERTARIAYQTNRAAERVPLKTTNSRRTVDLPGSLVTRLAALKLASRDSSPSAFVFASPTGRPLDDRNVATRGLAAACKAAGLPVVNPHALRHAHASALLTSGEDLPSVSRRLGHSSVAVTGQVYAHLIEDAARRDRRRERLDDLYGSQASTWCSSQ